MSEIHTINPEKVVKEILNHIWCNVRETFAVKATGIVNVDTVHAVGSVDNVKSVTCLQTFFENLSQTPARDSVVATMKKNLATSPTDSEISGIDNISTFNGTPMYSESEGEGFEGEDRSPSSESSHRIHTETCLDNFVPPNQ